MGTGSTIWSLQKLIRSIYSDCTANYNSLQSLCRRFTRWQMWERAFSQQYLGYASDLLRSFVQHHHIIYGVESLVYNFHSLIHVPDDVAEYGHPEDNMKSLRKWYVNHIYRYSRCVTVSMKSPKRHLFYQKEGELFWKNCTHVSF